MALTRARWSDNDRYFGPFTYSRGGYSPLALVFGSGGDEDAGCRLRISGFGHTIIIALPQIIKPSRNWVDTSKYEWSSEGGGYWDINAKEYGFTVFEGAVHVYYGRSTHDSTTDRSKCYFLPWRRWRHVRHSLYDLAGNHHADLPSSWCLQDGSYEKRKAIEKSCPTSTFSFADYDGEKLTATTKIEEREWRLGEGRFKWLSIFRKPNVRRSLDISFSGETGPRKGSWKGGTVGHSIEMLPGELHEAAFRRYCAQNNMTFSGSI